VRWIYVTTARSERGDAVEHRSFELVVDVPAVTALRDVDVVVHTLVTQSDREMPCELGLPALQLILLVRPNDASKTRYSRTSLDRWQVARRRFCDEASRGSFSTQHCVPAQCLRWKLTKEPLIIGGKLAWVCKTKI